MGFSQYPVKPWGKAAFPIKCPCFKVRYIKHLFDSPTNQGGTCVAELWEKLWGFRLNQAACGDCAPLAPKELVSSGLWNQALHFHVTPLSLPDNPSHCTRHECFFLQRIVSHLSFRLVSSPFLLSGVRLPDF